ncbi:MAG: hypothetical protein RLZZ299_10 [Pseudomonadota bacterium]|jgi:xanthine dehydrogenase small subunit
MSEPIRFVLDDQPVTVGDAPPTRTLLQWLRSHGKVGTKEGCAEGDCGACTVALEDTGPDGAPRLRAVNSCILLLPMVDGRRLWTVEGIGTPDAPHPVQQAMVERLGSQCGYCTPGFVMSLFEAHHRKDLDAAWKLDDQVCGNLCRCTGYRPIKQALADTAGTAASALPAARTPVAARTETFHYQAEGAHFVAPRNLQDGLEILAAFPDARIVAGATDLGLHVTKGGQRFAGLLSVEHLPGLRGVTSTATGWRIGAATDLVTLEDWSATALPMLHRMLRYFGSRQIKHRATLGGNLCNASPIGDTPPVLLALDAIAVIATLTTAGPTERRVPLSAFFTGYRSTALSPGEILVAIEVPALSPDARTGAYKVSRRREMDISAVSAAFRLELDGERILEARVAYGGVAATPVRLGEVETLLRDAVWSDATAERAADLAASSIRPMSDHRGTADFRRLLVRNLLLGFREETRETSFRALPAGHCGTVVLDASPAGDPR